jgi:glycosyltransferase involved in cell wall biosynthesis
VLSIVIVNWNARDFLTRCLASIQTTLNVPHEVIVMDNASEDGSVEKVQAAFPDVKLIKSRKNLGFAAANNLGIREVRGEFVMLLNPEDLAAKIEGILGDGEQLNRAVASIDSHARTWPVGRSALETFTVYKELSRKESGSPDTQHLPPNT